MKDILNLLDSNPSINKINYNVKRSFMYKKIMIVSIIITSFNREKFISRAIKVR